MPTLQSKYGVPGRELGAGTQAQVMLLRVKSSKRIRSTQQPSKRVLSSAQATAISPADTERVPTTRLLSPDGNALLMPRAASGTLTTTLEEDVMPEQREAYRKKLLRRTSTGALSAMSISTSGGLIYAIKKFRPPRATETHHAYSYNVNGTHHVSEASQGSSQPSMASGKSFQQEQCHPMDWSSKFGLSSNEIKKRKQQQQQLEQEMRLREVQRLKQQKRQEKNQAKQLRLDQFPEYCMVMEFAAGGDLFNLLTKSYPPVSLHEKHCLWRQLVSGIQYMHSMGVAHRDLKPENILIDASGRILKITDFGIANVFKSVGDPNPLPCRGIIGSEPYIAPEEFHQEEYDPRAVDVWACGIIFYVMYYAAMPWARADRKKDGRYARDPYESTQSRLDRYWP
ncbi:serine/threonine-protein kinase HAL4/sat4 [Podila horticola]|nr:serine/threonine-protein kinase HAL4/sat4 [Podila horticola]